MKNYKIIFLTKVFLSLESMLIIKIFLLYGDRIALYFCFSVEILWYHLF